MVKFSFGATQKKILVMLAFLMPFLLIAQTTQEPAFYPQNRNGMIVVAILTFLTVLGFVTFLYIRIQRILSQYRTNTKLKQTERMKKYIENLNSEQIQKIVEIKKNAGSGGSAAVKVLLLLLLGCLARVPSAFAQDKSPAANGSLFSEAGIIITVLLFCLLYTSRCV